MTQDISERNRKEREVSKKCLLEKNHDGKEHRNEENVVFIGKINIK